MDLQAEVVAGCFSQDPEKSKQTGKELYLDPKRVYDSYQQMAEAESKLPIGERVDFVSVVTPNVSHFEIAKTFLQAGFNVVSDKPMTYTWEQAEALVKIVEKTRQGVRDYLQLHRLPAGAPCACDVPVRADGASAQSPGGIHPGLPQRRAREAGTEAGDVADRSRASPEAPGPSATSGRTASTWSSTSPATRSCNCARTCPSSSPTASSMRTPTCSCASRAAAKACFP